MDAKIFERVASLNAERHMLNHMLIAGNKKCRIFSASMDIGLSEVKNAPSMFVFSKIIIHSFIVSLRKSKQRVISVSILNVVRCGRGPWDQNRH